MTVRRPNPWLVGFAIYTVVAVLFAAQKVAVFSARGIPLRPSAILLTFVGIYTWAALTPPILWVSRRYPLGPNRWRRSLPAHLLLLPAVIVLDIGSYALLEGTVLPGYDWGPQAPPFPERLLRLLAWGAVGDLLWYGSVVAVGHALTYRELARDRQLETSRIEGRLARVKLQMLRMQLQPHFLFNTLNAVSALVRDEPESARRVLARLGDLLRRSLEVGGRETVALAEELATLEDYLEIQVARFSDRLTVTWEVAEGVEAARVPPMLLQPLVENAVRHGIARRGGAAGRIHVAARRADGRLEILVRDNGPGLPPGAELREGIGLGSTRARLRDLYGDDHRLHLARAPGGGLDVRLDLPFRPAPPARRPRTAAVPPPAHAPTERLPLRFLPTHPFAWAAIPIAWTALLVGQSLFVTGPLGRPLELDRLYLMALQAALWTGLTVLILLICQRRPLVRPFGRNVAFHLAANAGVFALGMAVFVGVDEATGWAMWQAPEPTSVGDKVVRFSYGASIDYVIRYWLIVGAAHALAYSRQLEEDELHAARLEARLARTELQLLTVQLQPRFLLETLASISAESERDPRRAERMLARLSDLLRIVLEGEERAEVSLEEELDLLDPYLRLQQARFPERLRVRRAVAPDALQARLPGLLLQPLVDHAVRRTLEGEGVGAVEIQARRRNGVLEVDVVGHGRESPEASASPSTQTLETTRLRLRQLYGAEHALRVEGDATVVRMRVEIPYVAAGESDRAPEDGVTPPTHEHAPVGSSVTDDRPTDGASRGRVRRSTAAGD